MSVGTALAVGDLVGSLGDNFTTTHGLAGSLQVFAAMGTGGAEPRGSVFLGTDSIARALCLIHVAIGVTCARSAACDANGLVQS